MLRITCGDNPYSRGVQGKANEPVCVRGLLLDAAESERVHPACDLRTIVRRLEDNAPRVAVIAGSSDHPAHVADRSTVRRGAAAVWNRGGVPFSFGVPVMCDGTAQSNVGMCYSLASRNAVTVVAINQMESHAYHGALVLSGCDKSPFALLNALASLDVLRRRRGAAPVFAGFLPSHVMRGGTIPDPVLRRLEELAADADGIESDPGLGEDLRYSCAHILQCTLDQAFQGIFERLVRAGLLSPAEHKDLELELAAATCHDLGGICAFNGTGNSTRYVIAALGLVHPAVELTTSPPGARAVDEVVRDLLRCCNDDRMSVSEILRANTSNAIRVHSAMGGSTNIMMHLVSAVISAGKRFTVRDLDRIRRAVRVPDLHDYSLTEGRDLFALARQYESGTTRGVESVLRALDGCGVPVELDAPTVGGGTWRERLAARPERSIPKERAIICAAPRRLTSGVDVLRGNFFSSAVVKISGMSDEQLRDIDGRIAVVLYYANEEEATRELLDPAIAGGLALRSWPTVAVLRGLHRTNGGGAVQGRGRSALIAQMLEESTLRVAVVIAGQGPRAFGMPEMFTPMQHINHNAALKRITTLISDGRYSGVTYGAAVGHVAPEAFDGGGLLYLRNGDLLRIGLKARRITLLDPGLFAAGRVRPYSGNLAVDRAALGKRRRRAMTVRRQVIHPLQIMEEVTDAERGVVPLALWEEARR